MTLCNAMMMCVGSARKGGQRLKTKTPPAGFRVPSVPFGVSSNPWVASTTEAASAASHEVVVPLRVFRREPYRLFGSTIPLRCYLYGHP
jgi:hypothetical protein